MEVGAPYLSKSALASAAMAATPDGIWEYDLLIIMDSSNERLLKGIVPSSEYGKIHYLMEYAGCGKRNVADPWHSGDFESCYRDVESGCRGLLAQL